MSKVCSFIITMWTKDDWKGWVNLSGIRTRPKFWDKQEVVIVCLVNKEKKPYNGSFKTFQTMHFTFQNHLCFKNSMVKLNACQTLCVRFSRNLFYRKQIQNSHETMPLSIFKEAVIINWKHEKAKYKEKCFKNRLQYKYLFNKFHFNRSK